MATRAWAVVAAMTTAVIVFAAARGVRRGYQPLHDNALAELRAWDVLGEHRPLLGTWSSASLSAGIDVNHPGPLLFDLLALPVRVLGGAGGLAFGAAGINIFAVWCTVLVARRVAGDIGATAAALAAAVLAWGLGSEVLYDVWMPNVLVLPFLAVLVSTWAVVAGHAWAFPLVVGVGSLCLQVHLSYVFLVPGLVVTGVVALVVRDGRQVLARHGRWLGAGVAVGLVLSAQPLWEQLSNGRDGNLARLARSSGSDGEVATGPDLAVRMLAEVVAIPPAWTRPGYETSVPLALWVDTPAGRTLEAGLVSLPVAALALASLGVVVGVLARAALRRGDPTVAAGAAVLAVAVIVGLVSAAIAPIGFFGLSPHTVRWMWSIGAFAFTLVLAGAGRLTAGEAPLRWRRAIGGAAVAVAAAVSLLTLPTYTPPAGPVDQQSAYPIVESVREQVRAAELDGVVLVDPGGLFFPEPYTSAVMAELARQGVPFVVRSESLARQVGEGRLATGPVDLMMWFAHGEAATDVPAGAARIAYDSGDAEWPPFAVIVEPADG